MSTIRFKKLLLNLGRLRRRQMLRPLRHRLRERALRSLERGPIARGAAIGIFFGILVPVAQIVFAIVSAVLLRANIIVAAATTFVSNPFTLPLIYYWAFRTGTLLLGRGDRGATIERVDEAAGEVVEEAADAAEHALDVTGWVPALLDWLSSVGPPVALGLLTLALAASTATYLVVSAAWSCSSLLIRRFRRARDA